MSVDAILVRLGLAIRARREAMRTSQEEFADRVGTNRAYYGDVERGTRNLTIRSLERIARGLETSILTLFEEAEDYQATGTVKRESGRPQRIKQRRR